MSVLFNPASPEFQRDPYPVYAELRRETPVYRHPAGMHVVTGYTEVLRVLKTPDVFSSSAMGGTAPRIEADGSMRPGRGALIGLDPPAHGEQRRIVSRGFTPRRIAELEPRIRAIAEEFVAKFVHTGACDLIGDLGSPMPVTVIAELLGLDPSRRDDFKRWSTALVIGGTSIEGGEGRRRSRGMMHEFSTFMNGFIEETRQNPGDNLVSVLISAEQDAGTLDAAQVFSFAMLLLIAGSETTTNLIGNAVIALLQHPEQLEEVLADRSLVPQVLEETLRWDSPVQLLMRMTVEDTELGGVKIPKGNMVMPVLAGANRDPEQFPDPERFDIHRDTQGHLAFGFGNHFCLGASLARLEARIALENVLERMSNLRLDTDVIERHASFLIRGPRALPLRFDA